MTTHRSLWENYWEGVQPNERRNQETWGIRRGTQVLSRKKITLFQTVAKIRVMKLNAIHMGIITISIKIKVKLHSA